MDHQQPISESHFPLLRPGNEEMTVKRRLLRPSSTSSLDGLNEPRSRHHRRVYSDCPLLQDEKRSVDRKPLGTPKRRRRLRRTRWLIPADHPLKITWDVLTLLLSMVYIYVTHTSIRDRSFGPSNFGTICDAWFLIDILLNFVTEYRTDEGLVLRQGTAVWARYLTTWFAVDALSLVPWESFYIRPIIEMQNKRRFFKKYFFRTRAVIRVTRVLRGRHLRLFGQVAKHTKHAGVGARRLLRLLIKYVPKYLLFFRNMKAIVAVRLLRQVHWIRKIRRNMSVKVPVKDDSTLSTFEEWEEDDYITDEEYEEQQVYIDYDEDILY